MRMRKLYSLILLSLFSLQTFAGTPSYCLDNEKVHAYLTRGTYDSNNYNYTWITDYCYEIPWKWKELGGVRYDRPLPAKIFFASTVADPSIVYVSEDSNYEDAYTMIVDPGADSVDFYNLIPNRSYYWKLETQAPGGTPTLIQEGQFTTTGMVRMLKIDGIYNVRDMGGWTGLGGNPIKYGKLIRGSRLNVNGSTQELITAEGKRALLEVGVRADLDLRDAGDAPMAGGGARHSYLGDTIPIVNIDGAYGSRIATFADKPQSIRGIKQIIAWLKQDKPVYFHCSVGADRTGTVAYLIGALCGMSEDALCKEFELTSFSADSVPNSRDNGNPEVLIRQRTYVGRVDPNDDNESYKFANMVAKIKAFPGNTLQEKVYYHLRTGVNGESIPTKDLAWLVKYLVDYVIPEGIECGADTIRLNSGQSFALNTKVVPEEAGVTATVTYKSTNKSIATVSETGVVTAVNGGEALILVSCAGFDKIIPVIVNITDDNIQQYSVENSVVSGYMNNVQYVGTDYSTSLVGTYHDDNSVVRKDWPTAVTLKWLVFNGATNQHLIVSKNADFGYPIVDTQPGALGNQDSTYRIEGLDPQIIYYYKITGNVDGKTLTLTSSAFKASGIVRMIKLQNVSNVRDLGGWTGYNGHKVKYGALYRGSRLIDNTANGGMAMVNSEETNYLFSTLKIKGELDFRNSTESTNAGSVLSVRTGKFKKISDADQYLGGNILNGDAYIEAMNQIITWLKGNRNVYMSGSLGAERTGTMAFLINGLLGVSESDLAKDYELSSFSSDKSADVLCKRSDAVYADMVSAIKSLNGDNLQQKIYKYFKEGIGGTKVSDDDLKWFIAYMLECNESEVESGYPTSVMAEPVKAATGIIYNLLGQEVVNPGPGVYIMDGKKYIIR